MTNATTGRRYFALAADNLKSARDVMADRLGELGFEVVRARDPEEADELLKSRYFHLALIDLRLRDDTDGDMSGMWVVRENDLPAIRIITSNFPTQQAQEEYIYQLANAQMSPVVVFVPKDESKIEESRKLPAVVRSLMTLHLRINEQAHLTDESGRDYSARDLLDSLYPAQLPEHYNEHLRELEDIVRMVFYDNEHPADAQPIRQVSIRQLGAPGWLLVQAFDCDHQTRIYLIGIGSHDTMTVEQQRAITSPAFHTLFVDEDYRRTVHYRANSYRYFPQGIKPEQLVSLEQALDDVPNADVLRGWIDALNLDFHPTAPPPEVRRSALIDTDTDFDARLSAALNFLQRSPGDWRINDEYLLAGDMTRVLLNPVGRVNDLLRQPVKHIRRRVHGQVWGRTLVDLVGNRLLTYDYAGLRDDHALTDIISVLHHAQLACLGDLPLSERVAMIEAWQSRQSLGDAVRLSVVSDALDAKADHLLIGQGGMTEQEASQFIAQASLVDAIQALTRYNLDLPMPPQAMADEVGHLVVVAAVMTAWLSGITDLPPADVLTGVYVVSEGDSAGLLWVQSKPYPLRGNDYLLMSALLRQPGELITYEQLNKARYDSSGSAHNDREAIQQAMKRLRDRLSEWGLWETTIVIDTVEKEGYRARILIG